jgi:hypothetical protein
VSVRPGPSSEFADRPGGGLGTAGRVRTLEGARPRVRAQGRHPEDRTPACGSARVYVYVDPGVYLEAVLPLITEALSVIMDATPVETLSGVDAATLSHGPPDDDDLFRPAVRQRLRLLAGLA